MQTPSRYWLPRMSLRSLMLLVLVAGGGLGWFALQRQREARRQWVIATIQASGSSVEYDGNGDLPDCLVWRQPQSRVTGPASTDR